MTFVNLKNNGIVQKGDTLVQLTEEKVDTEKANNQEATFTIQDQIHDLNKLCKA